MSQQEATFWDHLDELRGVLVRIIVAVVLAAMVAFLLKDQLFAIILAPKDSDFITFYLLDGVISLLSLGEGVESFSVDLINTQLTQQFITHITMAIYAGFLVVFPYLLYELFRFVSPALYVDERRYTSGVVASGYVMFLLGVALNYFLIFPLTFRFLGSYQVSEVVVNMISLESYIGTFMMLNMMMGLIFEMPILCWLFAKLGFISAAFMKEYRRHAVVLLLFVAALITPTVDVVTLILVAMPMYLLYEVSILIVQLTSPKQR